MQTMNPAAPRRPWFREPIMWLVVGGPLVVVVASLITVWIAVRHADTVLPREAAPARVAEPPDRLGPEERLQAEKALLPAAQARNHVVSPTLPKGE
ncbi:hypothetical protein Tsedi_01632 [Tepidimonas sediminis]|uniref:Nitrogen fixation protein FixH n=2 Tax=Tepidimonas sediminis TaxID=2588941 RepID=A0A554WNB9_9BURK|nr:hypothetical protein Tsedi_01632 [Tepidimonas sediminis]